MILFCQDKTLIKLNQFSSRQGGTDFHLVFVYKNLFPIDIKPIDLKMFTFFLTF